MYGNDDFVPVLLGTGVGAYNVARSLHEVYGVRSLALGRAALHETAHSAIVGVRAHRDFDSADAVVATLLKVAEEFPDRKLLLIPTIEYYTNVALDHREALEEHFIVPLVSRETADALIDKSAFYATCEKHQIPHPRSVIVPPAGAGEEPEIPDLPFSFPVIAKPSNTDIYPRLHFAGKEKVYLVDDAVELVSVLKRVNAGGYDDDMVVQEFIPGDETVMRVANTYSDRNGTMRSCSVGQVVMADHDPTMVGNNNAIISVDDPDLTASLRSLLDAIGYTGTANFDVMKDPRDGVSKVLEVNLRLGATAYYATAAGANIVPAIVEDRVYGRDPGDLVTTDSVLWINLPRWVSRIYTPKALRPQVKAAARRRTAHTLRYHPDLTAKRFITVMRIDLRYALSTFKYGRAGMNQ